jgi:F-type H+-transporting ATPase subunit delta
MARLDKVAGRYAKAIFGYLKSEPKVKVVQSELEAFAHLVDRQPELKRIFYSRLFSHTDRSAVIDDLCGRLKLSDDTRRTLRVISEMKRLESLKSIADKLGGLLLEAAQTVPLQVEAVSELGNDEKKKLEQKFSKILGKKIEAKYRIDPSLIGGVRVTAGGRTYDGSVSGWLSNFEERLVGGVI